MKRYSIIHNMDRCYECKCRYNLHIHEVFFGTANRKKSIEDGMCVSLCGLHHNQSEDGVHGKNGRELDLKLKRDAQLIWMNYYKKDVEDFIKRFGKSFI